MVVWGTTMVGGAAVVVLGPGFVVELAAGARTVGIVWAECCSEPAHDARKTEIITTQMIHGIVRFEPLHTRPDWERRDPLYRAQSHPYPGRPDLPVDTDS
jgi:hypothetical protein